MPFAGYKDFAACVAANSGKKDPKAYCAAIMRATEGVELIDADEAVFSIDESTHQMRAKITILQAGLSKNRRNYPEAVVRRAAESGLYDGLRMFEDHSKEPPIKRPMRELISAVESTSWDPVGKRIVGDVVFFDKVFFEKAQLAKNYMGASVSQYIQANRVRQSDGSVVEEVTDIPFAKSVDWVVYPAAGGEILAFEGEGDDDVDWSTVTLEMIQKEAPELFKQITEAIKADLDKKTGDGGTPANESLSKEDIAKLVAEGIKAHNDAQAEEARKRAEALAKVQESVQKSGLPEKTRNRVSAQFASVTEFVEKDVTEAINAAREELKAAGAGPHIVGMGSSSTDETLSDHPSGVSVSESVADYFHYKSAAQIKKEKEAAAAKK